MWCLHCDSDTKIKCVDSRPSFEHMAIRRRWTCTNCGYMYTSLEFIVREWPKKLPRGTAPPLTKDEMHRAIDLLPLQGRHK